jgi:hypothetical protein
MKREEIQQFLGRFHGEEQSNFRCIKGKVVKDLNSRYNEQAEKILQQLNEQGYEVYFVPNSGGYANKDIHKFNTVFIDLDCGKRENGNYFDLDAVESYKQEKLKQVGAFELEPSYIVETRNGLHVYWLLSENVTAAQFTDCEERLISFFDGDKVVKNPARLLRLPNFNWCKDLKATFTVKIIHQREVRYAIDTLLEKLPEVVVEKKSAHDRENYKKLLSTDGTKPRSASAADNLVQLGNKNISYLQERLQPEGVTLTSHDEVYDYLKKQDMQELLGLQGTTFNCLFHEDRNPSAGVIINEETGHHIYNCMSSHCGISLTIIQVVERLTKQNRVNSLRFLRKLYKVEYEETDWQKDRKEILYENQRLLFSPEFTHVYPEIDKMINRHTVVLSFLNQLSINYLQTENFTDKQGNPIFFASSRYLAQKCGKDAKRLNEKISLFTYLGLMRKVPEDEIPEFLLTKAKSEAAKKKQKNLINFYSIPPYGEETFIFTKKKIKEYKEMGFTARGWGRELLLRTLGEEETNRVFPQMEGKKIPEKNQRITSQIEETAMRLIDHKGYVTESDILRMLVIEGSQSAYEKQIKRTLPDMLSKYGLQRSRLNKELKIQLGIEEMDGYPIVMYRN